MLEIAMRIACLSLVLLLLLGTTMSAAELLKVGIIGLDTSHAPAFAKEMNHAEAKPDVAGCRVVAAYPQGSADIQSSVMRIPGYIEEMKKMDIEVVDSIDELLAKVDCVLLETNDGRPHLEQALLCFKAGKPVFIDKPVAGSLSDAVAIYAAAAKYHCPVFSSSALRFGKSSQDARLNHGKITKAEASSPASLEKTHPDLFWYGIHGVETLFTVMGTGCESVQRSTGMNGEIVVQGTWSGGRTGTFREKKEYTGLIVGEKGEVTWKGFEGYRPLVVEIVKFFKTKEPPVSAAETIELYAFMEAADESKRRSGSAVKLSEVLEPAKIAAEKRLAKLGVK